MSEYIERDAAISAAIDAADEWDGGPSRERWAKINAALESIPAADVRPVVRGRWEWDVLDGTPGYRPVVLCCSNCHRVSFSGWDYCPNCGADMREES